MALLDKVIAKINTISGIKSVARKYDNSKRVWLLTYAGTSSLTGTIYCLDLDGNIIALGVHTLSAAAQLKYPMCAIDNYLCIALPDTSGNRNYTWKVYQLSGNTISSYKTSSTWGNYPAIQCVFAYKDNNDQYWVTTVSNNSKETPTAYNITTGSVYRTESTTFRVYCQYYLYNKSNGYIKGIFWNHSNTPLYYAGYKEEALPYGAKTLPGDNVLNGRYYTLMFPIIDFDNDNSDLHLYELFMQDYTSGTTAANSLHSLINPENPYVGSIVLPWSTSTYRPDLYGVLHDGLSYYTYNISTQQYDLVNTSDYKKCITYSDIYQINPYFDTVKNVGISVLAFYNNFYNIPTIYNNYPAVLRDVFKDPLKAITYKNFDKEIASLNISEMGIYKDKSYDEMVIIRQNYLCSLNDVNPSTYTLAYFTQSYSMAQSAINLFISVKNDKFHTEQTTDASSTKIVRHYDGYLVMTTDTIPFTTLIGINDEYLNEFTLNANASTIIKKTNTTLSSAITKTCTNHVYTIAERGINKVDGNIYAINTVPSVRGISMPIIFVDLNNSGGTVVPPKSGTIKFIVNGEEILYTFSSTSGWTSSSYISNGWQTSATFVVPYFTSFNVNYAECNVTRTYTSTTTITANTVDNANVYATIHSFGGTQCLVFLINNTSSKVDINYTALPSGWKVAGYGYKIYDTLPSASTVALERDSYPILYESKLNIAVPNNNYIVIAKYIPLKNPGSLIDFSLSDGSSSPKDDYTIITMNTSSKSVLILTNAMKPFDLYNEWFAFAQPSDMTLGGRGIVKAGKINVYANTYSTYYIPECFKNKTLVITLTDYMGISIQTGTIGFSANVRGITIKYNGSIYTYELPTNESTHTYTLLLTDETELQVRANYTNTIYNSYSIHGYDDMVEHLFSIDD